MNANDRIKQAMKLREKNALSRIRRANRRGEGMMREAVFSDGEWKALDRLAKRGLIFYNRRGSWKNPRRGWWLVSEWRKRSA